MAEPGTPQTGLPHVNLTISGHGRVHRFDVEVASTPDQQETGMMFRRSVPPNSGMLFAPFPPEGGAPVEATFWMKNTLVPLDIIYIRPDGTIVRITKAKALDETPLPSGEPISAVLEIRGGRAAELGIREGDVASWPH